MRGGRGKVKRARPAPVPAPPPPLPTPIAIALNPAFPSILDDAGFGSSVAGVEVTMSDGSPFVGVLSMVAPFSNDGGRFFVAGSALRRGQTALPTGNSTRNITIRATPDVGLGTGAITQNFTIAVTASQPAPGNGPNMKVVLNVGGTPNSSGDLRGWSGGTDYVFEGSTATDLGNYVGEYVSQQCWIARNNAAPHWRVFFRPDVGNTRYEVVLEYGDIRYGQGPSDILQPAAPTLPLCNAKIYINDVEQTGGFVGPTPVPSTGLTGWKMFTYARWRWQSALRPVVRDAQTIFARKWALPYSTAAMNGGDVPFWKPYKICGYCGLEGERRWGTGGDQDQIGPTTELIARYLLTGLSLDGVRAQAESHASAPYHYRDNDHNLLNLELLWEEDTPGGFHNFNNLIPQAPNIDTSVDPDIQVPKESHLHPNVWIPWCLTDDPFFAEEQQFMITWAQATFSAWRSTSRGVVPRHEPRVFAWCLRDLMLAAMSAPVTAPSWMRSKSYWTTYVGHNKSIAELWLSALGRPQSIFHAFIWSDVIKPWEVTYIRSTLFFMWYSGFDTTWAHILDWLLYEAVIMSDGTSGWNIRQAAPYVYYLTPGNPRVEDQWTFPDGTQSNARQDTTARDSFYYASWPALYTGFLNGAAPPTGNALLGGQTSYSEIYRAALVMAEWRRQAGSTAYNLPSAGTALAALMPYFNNWRIANNRKGLWAWSLIAPQDDMTAALAATPANTWSAAVNKNNLYSTGLAIPVSNDAAYRARYYVNANQIISGITGEIFAYSSGDLDPDRNRYGLFGSGGHGNAVQGDGFFFDLSTLTWALTQQSAKIGFTVAPSSLSPDATLPFHTDARQGILAFRNAAGEFMPISNHLYCGIAYCKGIVPDPANPGQYLDRFIVQGASPASNDGSGGPGGMALVNAATGKVVESECWDSGTSVYAPNGTTRSVPFTVEIAGKAPGEWADAQRHWLENIKRIWSVTTTKTFSITRQAYRADPITKTWQYGGAPSFINDPATEGMGFICPDPFNSSHKAWVCLRDHLPSVQSGAADAADLDSDNVSTRKMVIYREIDRLNTNLVATFIKMAAKPAPIRGPNARPFWLGDIVPGSLKVAWFGDGGSAARNVWYLMDMAPVYADPINGEATWAGPFSIANAPNVGGQLYRRLVYSARYDAFILFAGNFGDNVRVLKRPSNMA